MAAKEQPKDPKALPSVGEGGEPPKKKSRAKKFIILFLILLLTVSAAGAGAYWWFVLRPAAPVTEEAEAAPPAEAPEAAKNGVQKSPDTPNEGIQRIERQSQLPRSTGQVLPLPEFVVNLSDPAGKRYLKLGMEVEVNADVGKAIQAQSAKIRDAVIMLLAGKTYEEISSPEGKVLLKAEVGARLNQILGGAYVVRVYFTEFMVQ